MTLLTIPITFEFNKQNKKCLIKNGEQFFNRNWYLMLTDLQGILTKENVNNSLMLSPIGMVTGQGDFQIIPLATTDIYSPRTIDLRRTRNIRIIINYNTNSHDTFAGNSITSNICSEIPIPYFFDTSPISYNLNADFQFTPKIQVPGGSINNITFQILSDTNTFIDLNGGGYRFQLVFRIYPEIELPIRDEETLLNWEKRREKQRREKQQIDNIKLIKQLKKNDEKK